MYMHVYIMVPRIIFKLITFRPKKRRKRIISIDIHYSFIYSNRYIALISYLFSCTISAVTLKRSCTVWPVWQKYIHT